METYYSLLNKVTTYFNDMACEDCCHEQCSFDEELCRSWIVHTFHVFTLCGTFIDLLGASIKQANKEMLLFSAILHDIAKPIDNDEQNNKQHLLRAFAEASITIPPGHLDSICSIIGAHKSGAFDPPRELAAESAILRICDKLDKFRVGSEEAEMVCEGSKDLIVEYFDSNSLSREREELEKIFYIMKKFATLY